MAKTETDRGGRPAEAGGPAPDIPGLSTRRTSSATGMIIKIILLGLVLALAIFGVIPLIADGRWLWLAIVVAVTAIIFYVYLSPRVIPLKYLLPGTLFLIAFVVYPGHRHRRRSRSRTSATAIAAPRRRPSTAIEGASVQQVPGSTVYQLTVATEGDPATGDIVFLLVDPETQQPQVGTAEGLEDARRGLGPDRRRQDHRAPRATPCSTLARPAHAPRTSRR